MELAAVSISSLRYAAYNPRIDLKPGDPEYERLKKSVIEFDYVEPIVWNRRTGNIVGGHQRAKILAELGYTEVDVSVVDLTDEKEKALNLALNKTGGDWDLPKLKDILLELDTGSFDIEITGFSEEELEQLMSQFHMDEPLLVNEDDFDVDAALDSIQETRTRRGDLWILGRHRLLCGDSTDESDIKHLMAGNLADMVFTDPPYNVDYTGKTEDALKIENDHMSDVDFKRFLLKVYGNLFSISQAGAAIYVCHADSEGINFRSALVDSGWLLKQCIIWVKQRFVMGRQDYHWRHEPILYGWKPGAAHRWYADRKQDTVWEFNRPSRNAEHPTMKPIELVANAIRNSSQRGGLVVDLFGGSGSTLMAAEQSDRVAYLSEIDPKYCDVIVQRWESFTGQTAVKQ